MALNSLIMAFNDDSKIVYIHLFAKKTLNLNLNVVSLRDHSKEVARGRSVSFIPINSQHKFVVKRIYSLGIPCLGISGDPHRKKCE